ncbi:MAG TPA: type II toxin-antitoxin system VapC family toxin [Turneriella sp.]|nr:type II toxin-antitoxin system VapC family toxin [Turneriella sp.]HNE21059.1 type II toxin-antitoxin system VapC family toxin [Turneriella sp.]HNL10994.1 type II toxin-antitoxin system VapC family toxin [Turneriella sp.]HNL55374.1 type II toxin-antitoxin system VapC family toxin [Turneriella sp.]
MNIVDSSGWLEYLAGSKNGDIFGKYIENTDRLIVPVITIYEVFKKILTESNEENALKIAAHMRLGRVIDIDLSLSLEAAKFGKQLKLPMADALIYATARKYDCTIWTQDEHFKGLEGVQYFPK